MVVSVTCGASPCSWGIAATVELSGQISANYVRGNGDGRPGASHSYLRSSTAIDLKLCIMMMPVTVVNQSRNVCSLTEENRSTLWARCNERFVLWARSASAIYTVALLRQPDKHFSLLHITDRSRAFVIYPAPAIWLRITYAKPEKDEKGSHGELVGKMEDDCSMEYGSCKVTRHGMNSSS